MKLEINDTMIEALKGALPRVVLSLDADVQNLGREIEFQKQHSSRKQAYVDHRAKLINERDSLTALLTGIGGRI